jgi:hypothetical protein
MKAQLAIDGPERDPEAHNTVRLVIIKNRQVFAASRSSRNAGLLDVI